MDLEVVKRFWKKIEKSDNCWNWTASLDKDGYGKFTNNKKSVKAHRFSYELLKEYIPKGFQLDHLCHNRKCVNPDHLEIVTLRENIKRGLTGKINHWRKNKTHCPQGHEYTQGKNQRICLICHRNSCRKYRLKLKKDNINNSVRYFSHAP